MPFFTVPSISSSPIDRSDCWGSMGLSLCIVYALDCPVIDSAQSGGAATPQAPGVDACGASPCQANKRLPRAPWHRCLRPPPACCRGCASEQAHGTAAPASAPSLPSAHSRPFCCPRSRPSFTPDCESRLSTRCSTSSKLRPRSPATRSGDTTCGVAVAGICQISCSVSTGP